MNISEGVADLHLHTMASDGTCLVADRCQQAHEIGLDAIAVTDHDTIADDVNQRVLHHGNLEIITGVEVRADILDTKVELIGYYIDPTNTRLKEILKTVRSHRRNRNRRIINRLQEETNLNRTYEKIRAETNGILGRPHIASTLIKDGIVDSIGAAFETYLGADGTAFVPMERVPAVDVIETIQGAGGVVSLAHPGRVRTDNIETIVENLVADGLDGIEVAYPYDEAPSEGYADVGVEDAAAFAESFNLLQTGGSDCHGPESGKFRIGEVRVTRTHLDAIRQRAIERRPL